MMARRKSTRKPTPATENKDAQQPPENKDDEPAQNTDESQQNEDQQQQGSEEQDEDSLLDAYVVMEEQLNRLLKAEGRYWTGEIGRMQLHQTAERIREELAGETEEKDEDQDDG